MNPFTDPRTGIEYVPVAGGSFMMGSEDLDDDTRPVHRVEVSAFFLGRFEVTRAQYSRYMAATGASAPAHWTNKRFIGDEKPVIAVTWDEAVAFCKWADGRLPTEAEWEYAARGSEGRKFPWGNTQPDLTRATFAMDIGFDGTRPVGAAPAGGSPFGALDLAGNAFEWCSDWYSPNAYAGGPTRDPSGPEKGTLRVIRGGSWISLPDACRSSARTAFRPESRSTMLGFRVARVRAL